MFTPRGEETSVRAVEIGPADYFMSGGRWTPFTRPAVPTPDGGYALYLLDGHVLEVGPRTWIRVIRPFGPLCPMRSRTCF